MVFRRIFAIMLAFSLFAAACGDDDPTATEEPAAAPDDTADAAADEPADDAAADDAMADDAAADDAMADDAMAGWPDKLIFGFVPSQEQDQLLDDIQPFMAVLEEALGIPVEGTVTTDYTGLVTAMGNETADLGAFGPFGYTLGADTFGNIEALIQSIRFGAATYHGQWFTNDASICNEPPVEGTALINDGGEIVQVPALDAVALQVGVYFGADGKAIGEMTDAEDAVGADVPISSGYSCIADLSAVAGKTVAFTSETSTSGYLFPALDLTNLGIDPASGVTPIFTGGHDAAVISVYNGDADVGLSFDDARRTIRGENPDVGEKVIVFSITGEIPNDVVAVRSDLPDDLKDAIYDAVAAFLDTDEGEAIFDEIYGWTDIRRAVESDFDVVRQAATTLGITEPPG